MDGDEYPLDLRVALAWDARDALVVNDGDNPSRKSEPVILNRL